MEKNEKTTTTEKEVTSEKEAAEKETASTASENKKSSNKRKWLKIGGAILAGVGAFGAGFGAGYMLSNYHQNHAESSSAAESEPVGGVAIEPI